MSNKNAFSEKSSPTQRAVDAGESARFQAFLYASAFFHLDGVPQSAPAPLTPAVGRWLIGCHKTMNTEMSPEFQNFHNHVFGHGQYFYYNGLADEVCTNLKGAERITAEKMVLDALPNSSKDERPIRAAGHFKLKSAIPIFERLLLENKDQINKNVKAAITWATLKIQNEKTQLKLLIDFVVLETKTINDLERDDATDLLSEFGKEPTAIDALLVAFADKDLGVRFSARYALYKLFKDNVAVCELLDFKKFFGSSHDERVETAKRIKEMLCN